MKTQKLIPLLDYVLEQDNKNFDQTDYYNIRATRLENIVNYAKFLSQPLKLSQFVPCDNEGNVLEDPSKPGPMCRDCADENGTCPSRKNAFCDPVLELEAYNKAKSNVLFEGFEKGQNNLNPNSWQIENKDKSTVIVHYKSQPDYFIWNYSTIDQLSKHGVTLTENAVKLING